MKTLARILAALSAVGAGLIYVRYEAPTGALLWIPKLFAGALSPFIALLGALAALLGASSRARLAALAGGLSAGAAARYVRQVTTLPDDPFTEAFGPDWPARIPPERQARLLPRRWVGRLPQVPEPRWERDLPFWTIPDSGRTLLCDVWQPPAGVAPSELAFLYFHGSGWYLLDKDFGTRPLFRHLAAQGHVVMDVAYRLYPETDIPGMVGDVKRAVAWIKAQAGRYGVDPARVVLGGGSAGGQLALLAAYAPDHPRLTPDDVRDADRSVRAVVGFYALPDLRAAYYHLHEERSRLGRVPPPDWGKRDAPLLRAIFRGDYERLGMAKVRDDVRMDWLLGGSPEEVPDEYTLLSPISHIHPGCPPTLLIQGADDVATPVAAADDLARRLRAAGVPVVNRIFPHTDHGFDLTLPEISPPAQSALYDLERFLALLAQAR